jgi:hypothetical protein
MAKGGKREGAGRKPGSKSKRTLAAAELRDKLLSDGETPLEVLYDYMRRGKKLTDKLMSELEATGLGPNPSVEKIEAVAALMKETRLLIHETKDTANMAAPYSHPRLANIEVDGHMTLTLEEALGALD